MAEIRKQYERTRLPEMAETFGLIMDCSTRWNSTYDMVERLCRHQWLIRQYLETLPPSRAAQLEMTDAHWLIIQKLVSLLEPIKTATTFLEGEKYVSLSSVVPVIRGLLNKYAPQEEVDGFEAAFTKWLTDSLKSRFQGSVLAQEPKIHHKATFLDPRYRSSYFTRQENAQVKCTIEQELQDQISPPDPQRNARSLSLNTPAPPCQSSLSDILTCGKLAHSDFSGEDDPVEAQATWYVQQKIPPQTSTEPTLWWQANQGSAMGMYKIAKRYLCIPATSAPAERVFSSAGLTIGKLRT